MPTADSHLHIFADGFSGELGTSPSGGDELAIYEQLRHEYGIERGLVLAFEGKPQYIGNTTTCSSWLHPSVDGTAGPSCLRAGSHGRDLAGAASSRCTGCRGLSADRRRRLCHQGVAGCRTGRTRVRQRAIVSINAGPAATTAVTPAVEQMENCTVLFSHLGQVGPWTHPPHPRRGRAKSSSRCSRSPAANTSRSSSRACTASAIRRHDFPHTAAQPVIDLVLDGFGPGRLMWGSDYAPLLDFVTFVQAADTRLLGTCTQAEVDGMMGGNLLRLLNAR